MVHSRIDIIWNYVLFLFVINPALSFPSTPVVNAINEME